jgi:hypothetical protein
MKWWHSMAIFSSFGLLVASTPLVRGNNELEDLKKKHLQSAQRATQMIDERYRVTLRRLEQEKAESGDYLGAAVVKARLEQMERIEPESLLTRDPPLSASAVGARSLRLNAGTLLNGARYDANALQVLLQRPEQAIEWLLNSLTVGRYRVEMIYAAVSESEHFQRNEDEKNLPATAVHPSSSLAELEVSLSEGVGLSQRIQRQNLTIQPTGSLLQTIRRQVTIFEVGPRAPTLRVQLTSQQQKGDSTLALRVVELVPIIPDQPIKLRVEDPSPTSADLSSELKAQQQTLWALRESLAAEYDQPLTRALDFYQQHNLEDDASRLLRWQRLWLDLAAEPAYPHTTPPE